MDARKVTLITIILSGLAYANLIYAAVNDTTDLVTKVICPTVDAMFYILMAVSTVMIMWAAYLFVTAEDDAEKVSKARKTITYAAIGIVVAFLAKAFPEILYSTFSSVGDPLFRSCS